VLWGSRLILFLANCSPLALCIASDAVEILSVGYILTSYRDGNDEKLSSVQQQLLTAAVFLGMLVGGLASGVLSDSLGRRKCLLASLSVNFMFALASSASRTVAWLVTARVLVGLGVGGSLPVAFTLGAEVFPRRLRGKMLSLVASAWVLGSCYAAGTAWLMIPRVSWRFYIGVASLPAGLTAFLSFGWIPESPRYFANRGDSGGAAAALSNILGHLVLLPAMPEVEQITAKGQLLARVRLLLAPKARKTTLVMTAVWFTLSFGSYGISTWNNVLFSEIGLTNPYASSFIFAAANLPGILASFLLVERMGRRRLLAVSMTAAAASASLFAYSAHAGPWLVVTAASLFNACSVSGWNALECLSAESFPTNVRTSGMGWVSAFGRLGSILAQFVNGYLQSSVFTLLMVTSGVMLIGALLANFLPLETAGISMDEERQSDGEKG
jgi:MFS family permease